MEAMSTFPHHIHCRFPEVRLLRDLECCEELGNAPGSKEPAADGLTASTKRRSELSGVGTKGGCLAGRSHLGVDPRWAEVGHGQSLRKQTKQVAKTGAIRAHDNQEKHGDESRLLSTAWSPYSCAKAPSKLAALRPRTGSWRASKQAGT
jgi:hypothetical protein